MSETPGSPALPEIVAELERFRRLFNEAQKIGQCGAFSWDLATNHILWSDEFFRLVGHAPDQIEHTWDGFISCVHDDDRDHVTRSAEKVIETGVHPPVNYRVVTASGEVRYLVSKGSVEHNEAGDPVRMVGFAQDVTKQKLYEAEIVAAREVAERASQAKSEFLAMMNHELRTPLTAIVGPADLLDTLVEQPEAREMVALIKQSSRHLLMVINDVLNLTRSEAGAIEAQRAPLALPAFLEDTLAPLRAATEAKGVAFRLHVDPDVPDLILTDPRLLIQVLNNVVGNAIAFTSEGSVSVHVYLSEDRANALTITVEDTGPGIPASDQAHIFEPFYQVDMSINRSHEGSGLGLTIAYNFMELLGGSVSVESEEGTGTRFHLVLPLEDNAVHAETAARAGTADEPEVIGSAEASSPRVLVVEDYPGTQYLLEAMLKQLGFSCDIAETGQQALQLYAERRHPVVLMDIRLPDMDGMEVTRRLRTIAGDHPPYVIAQTAYALTDESERIRQSGMDDLISKPFTYLDLKQALRRASLN